MDGRRSKLVGLAGAALALIVLGGCEARVPADRPPHPRADKRSLFGDPALVPTRAGERARRELALAGELGHALDSLGLGTAHVSVELGAEPPRVVITGVASAAHGDAEIIELAVAMIPEIEAPEQVHVWLRSEARAGPGLEAEEPHPPLLPLSLALLGLGLCLGVAAERARGRRQATSR